MVVPSNQRNRKRSMLGVVGVWFCWDVASRGRLDDIKGRYKVDRVLEAEVWRWDLSWGQRCGDQEYKTIETLRVSAVTQGECRRNREQPKDRTLRKNQHLGSAERIRDLQKKQFPREIQWNQEREALDEGGSIQFRQMWLRVQQPKDKS